MKLLSRLSRASSKGSDSSKTWDSTSEFLTYEESSESSSSSSFHGGESSGNADEMITVSSRYNQVGKVLKHLPRSASSVRSTMRKRRSTSKDMEDPFVDKEELCDRLIMEKAKLSDTMSSKDKVWSVKFLVQLDKSTQRDFVLEVHEDWAPLGAKRFKDLIDVNYFDDCRIYRVIKGFVIQWGICANPRQYSQWGENKIKDDKRTSRTPSNLRGYVSFATSGPDARGSQIFVNLSDDNAQLDDQGFVPFGKVTSGLEDCIEEVSDVYAQRGKKPDQMRAKQFGNEYFEAEFPLLSYIVRTEVQ